MCVLCICYQGGNEFICCLVFFFFFKQKTAYEMQRGLVGSEMCIRDRNFLLFATRACPKIASRNEKVYASLTSDSPEEFKKRQKEAYRAALGSQIKINREMRKTKHAMDVELSLIHI
eukprot:TRINITY_DN36322_c0_g1_i2.p5 TRINITY_DN36322_c0_g1~~TRINITY_DN36322_c0_g1_i2.p5  ORF type:complete len:117 (-),score=26.98 TRINITY_DN36322_c0_g1_i2:178-528(-)